MMIAVRRSSILLQTKIKSKTSCRCSFRHSTTTATATRTSNTTSSSSSTSIASIRKNNPFARVFRWYSDKLESHPILTKSLTAAIIGASGDVLCQYYIDKPEKEAQWKQQQQQQQQQGKKIDNNNNNNDSTNEEWMWWLDPQRAGRFFLLGGGLVGPWCHAWFGWLATTFPQLTVSSIATRVALDQLAFTPIILSTFISSLWTLEHVMEQAKPKASNNNIQHNYDSNVNNDDINNNLVAWNIPERLIDTLPSLWMTNIAVWTPVQLFNFGFVTQRYQVLFANMVSLAWNAYISFSTRGSKQTTTSDGSIVGVDATTTADVPVSAAGAPVVIARRMTSKAAAAAAAAAQAT
ncbi:Mpv17 / PMP22 family protein [Nitzschia inconspicua]|uniref:Mpv17 / PMP22 family protein n=1 Tax=Nitzschia inconspicua TaxID=303405 RepID=A0A9K3K8N5_9STRA|nr:Mpv17 / PMP22 family protein [Nitzschia inconspicua]KAG7373691.1 Mpv17 / PMP22 family protein [Nitzschia inconspicua]